MKKISSDTVEKFELTLEKLSMLFKKVSSFHSSLTLHIVITETILFFIGSNIEKIFILRLKAILKKKFEEKLHEWVVVKDAYLTSPLTSNMAAIRIIFC